MNSSIALLTHQKHLQMNALANIRFYENGMIKEAIAAIQALKKERDQEILYTRCGLKINLDQLESINGIRFS